MKSGVPRPSGDIEGDFPELKISDEQMGRRTSSEQLSESKLHKRAKSVTKVRPRVNHPVIGIILSDKN